MDDEPNSLDYSVFGNESIFCFVFSAAAAYTAVHSHIDLSRYISYIDLYTHHDIMIPTEFSVLGVPCSGRWHPHPKLLQAQAHVFRRLFVWILDLSSCVNELV